MKELIVNLQTGEQNLVELSEEFKEPLENFFCVFPSVPMDS